MAFDKTKPAGTTPLKQSDDQIRDNFEALESALDQDHDFTTGSTQMGMLDNVFRYKENITMKRRLVILLIFLSPIILGFSGVSIGLMSASTTTESPTYTWVYSGDGVYDVTNVDINMPTSYCNGGAITLSTAPITLKVLSVYIDDVGTATKGKIALYSSGDALLVDGGTFTPHKGWNDIVVSDTVLTSYNYRLFVQLNGNWKSRHDDDSSGFYAGKLYSYSWPSNISSNVDENTNWAVRLGY